MRRVVILALSALVWVGVAQPDLAGAAAFQRPNLELARTTFAALSPDERAGLHVMLMATGDFNAMVADRLGPRLYDAVASF